MADLQFHPLADLFPLVEGTEFDALVADIKAHGLREPIVMHEGMILDGRNRYRACEAAGITPRTVEWDQEGTAQEFVVSKNLHRRHLNSSQRAMIAAKLAGIKNGQNQHTIEGIQIRVPEAAALLNVGTTSVHNAKRILQEGTEEEIAGVETGEIGVNRLSDQIRANRPPTERSKRRAAPLAQTGKNPERIQRSQMQAEIWARLSDALIGLTSLPIAADVASIVNGNTNRRRTVDDRLARSLQWLKEFSDAWNANG